MCARACHLALGVCQIPLSALTLLPLSRVPDPSHGSISIFTVPLVGVQLPARRAWWVWAVRSWALWVTTRTWHHSAAMHSLTVLCTYATMALVVDMCQRAVFVKAAVVQAEQAQAVVAEAKQLMRGGKVPLVAPSAC